MNAETLQDKQYARRRELRRIPSEVLRQLLADYVLSPPDQPVTEKHVAARLAKSRAWCQWRRVAGNGPKFHRTPEGKIFYKKSDVEAYLSASLTGYSSTSEYAQQAAGGAK